MQITTGVVLFASLSQTNPIFINYNHSRNHELSKTIFGHNIKMYYFKLFNMLYAENVSFYIKTLKQTISKLINIYFIKTKTKKRNIYTMSSLIITDNRVNHYSTQANYMHHDATPPHDAPTIGIYWIM